MTTNVGRNDILFVYATPPVEITPDYSTGDLIGGEIEFASAVPSGEGVIIQSVIITDLAALSADIDVVFFSEEPTGTTFTENAALDIADADLPKIVGVAKVRTHTAFADNSVSQELNLAIPFYPTGTRSLWAVMVARATMNMVSTTDLTIRVGLLT